MDLRNGCIISRHSVSHAIGSFVKIVLSSRCEEESPHLLDKSNTWDTDFTEAKGNAGSGRQEC